MKKFGLKKFWPKIFLAGILAFPGPASPASAAESAKAAPPDLLPHRAIYKVTLAPNRGRGQVVGVDGRMVTELQTTCEGHITSQRIVTRMVDESDELSVSDISVSSWESLNGRSYQFTVRQRLDEDLIAEYEGNADTETDGGTVRAMLRKPVEKTVTLPKGVLFPNGYMKALLKAAHAGQRQFSGQLFDGTSDADYYQVVTSIGAGTTTKAAERNKTNVKPGMFIKSIEEVTRGATWWPVQMSYFTQGKNEGLPEFEIAFHLYDNGVSNELVMDYGAFALLASLQQIEAYKPSDC